MPFVIRWIRGAAEDVVDCESPIYLSATSRMRESQSWWYGSAIGGTCTAKFRRGRSRVVSVLQHQADGRGDQFGVARSPLAVGEIQRVLESHPDIVALPERRLEHRPGGLIDAVEQPRE